MSEIRELIKYFEDARGAEEIVLTTKGAILDPVESIRKRLIKDLDKKLDNSLQGGFPADNQLFIIVQKKGFQPIYYYVCNIPETYAGSLRIPHRFYRENNKFISI